MSFCSNQRTFLSYPPASYFHRMSWVVGTQGTYLIDGEAVCGSENLMRLLCSASKWQSRDLNPHLFFTMESIILSQEGERCRLLCGTCSEQRAWVRKEGRMAEKTEEVHLWTPAFPLPPALCWYIISIVTLSSYFFFFLFLSSQEFCT